MKRTAIFWSGYGVECTVHYDNGKTKTYGYIPQSVTDSITDGRLALVKTRETATVRGEWYEARG